MSNFRGIWVALVTPFRSGQVDIYALQGLAEKLLADGVRGLVVCGTTGEAAAMSKDEQLEVLDAVLQIAQPGQVIMGLSGNNLSEVLAFQQKIQSRDIAGVLVPAPYYIRPSQQGIESFFQTVADASSVPVVLYDIPYRTGVRIERETLRRIVRHPRIAAVKDCSGDVETTMALIADGNAEILTGEDIQILNNLALGGAGAISASAHISPKLYVQMMQEMDSGDLISARATLYRLLPWIRIAFIEPNPAVIKAALSVQGIITNELREPMQPCSSMRIERLGSVLSDLVCQSA
ncbi:4-hydroxy-tetrahydrodipicolinate synthase [Pseudomonas monteilii]|uniref:4-hydroxy-tetrahydrodipicolinate synthase n=1 Tax=Pseudomonas monteilii TaxID=76759 RepID=UPI001E4C996A|nr:4-hydroxy-tetrahydrodipicolinate synthase [Pseudomonas monteilii]MCE0877169.1 4-hydroxy-tetrahydrodipicolinate synthase [Pseudomonas monteilii]MCE0929325.1 4-hydroxy-tetrahydrodipicolinate synthase [Pseudomonas monteilii]MCE0935070.1 4-hydroxy-tetrahydrodipicolinate synthase [Pseudomonas monteilii]MCE1015599.1 4-hydroxy-tetrahydrodipicolinate synthase [Pseudomonas monteilii]MCE1044296.1 4-hydroxy-tetrahydrodipicolinate synthase [Pseudomonas monteilii]